MNSLLSKTVKECVISFGISPALAGFERLSDAIVYIIKENCEYMSLIRVFNSMEENSKVNWKTTFRSIAYAFSATPSLKENLSDFLGRKVSEDELRPRYIIYTVAMHIMAQPLEDIVSKK